MSDFEIPGIVADGQARAQAAAEPQIRKAVEEEYAERLAYATVETRPALRKEMERVIAQRLQVFAPPDALY